MKPNIDFCFVCRKRIPFRVERESNAEWKENPTQSGKRIGIKTYNRTTYERERIKDPIPDS